jgi:hypothetical protein
MLCTHGGVLRSFTAPRYHARTMINRFRMSLKGLYYYYYYYYYNRQTLFLDHPAPVGDRDTALKTGYHVRVRYTPHHQ